MQSGYRLDPYKSTKALRAGVKNRKRDNAVYGSDIKLQYEMGDLLNTPVIATVPTTSVSASTQPEPFLKKPDVTSSSASTAARRVDIPTSPIAYSTTPARASPLQSPSLVDEIKRRQASPNNGLRKTPENSPRTTLPVVAPVMEIPAAVPISSPAVNTPPEVIGSDPSNIPLPDSPAISSASYTQRDSDEDDDEDEDKTPTPLVSKKRDAPASPFGSPTMFDTPPMRAFKMARPSFEIDEKTFNKIASSFDKSTGNKIPYMSKLNAAGTEIIYYELNGKFSNGLMAATKNLIADTLTSLKGSKNQSDKDLYLNTAFNIYRVSKSSIDDLDKLIELIKDNISNPEEFAKSRTMSDISDAPLGGKTPLMGPQTGKGLETPGESVEFRHRHSKGKHKYVLLPAYLKGSIRLFAKNGGNPIVSQKNASSAFLNIVKDIVESGTFSTADYKNVSPKEALNVNAFIKATKPLIPSAFAAVHNGADLHALRKRYQVLVGELSVGNTGQLVKEEMISILRTLERLKAISKPKVNDLIKGLKEL